MILVTKTEIQDIQETLIKLIETFPELPSQVKKDGIFFEQLKSKNVSMCLSTIVNPRKSSIYVDDSYTCKNKEQPQYRKEYYVWIRHVSKCIRIRTEL